MVGTAPSTRTLLPWQRSTAHMALGGRAHWPHALLITGRRGVGKRVLALHFARSLLCEHPGPDGAACDHCPSCHYVDAGTHPDLRLLEPIVIDDEGNAVRVDAIGVERIRDLIEFTLLSTHRQRAKVALIAPAEAMNASAANALLKTLEEPPRATYLILVSHEPGRLPATISSRCRRMRAPEPSTDDATAWLAGQGIDSAELILAQAGGAPLLALQIADPETQRERETLLRELERPRDASPVAFGARLESMGKDVRKTRLAEALYWLQTWTADLATVAAGGAPRFNPDRGDALTRLARQVARVALFRYYRSLLQQRALLGHPLQPRLVAESMLFEYRALFTKEHRV